MFENHRAPAPIWEPDRTNHILYGGFIAMCGGPARQRLLEHEHPDVQLSVRFGRRTFTKVIIPMEPHSGSWEDGERVVVFQLSPALLAEAVDDLVRHGHTAVRSQHRMRDVLIEGLAGAALRELSSADTVLDRRLYFESIGYTLAGHVIRSLTPSATRGQRDGALSDQQLRMLSEFVDDTLGRVIGIADMASSVGLSPRRFATSFKNTTGLTPHQYVIRRRIGLAKRLLRRRDLKIVDVALLTGFANQSHFTMVFARLTGMTPSGWRANTW